MARWLADPRDVGALLALAVALAAAAPVLQEPDASQPELAAARQAGVRQAAAEAEAARLAQDRAAAATALRSLEEATSNAAAASAALTVRRDEAEARLQARAVQLAPMLPVIERLSFYPAETLLAVPSGAQSTLTGLLVLKGMARQLEADAEALRAEQAAVAQIGRELALQDRRLAAAQADQAARAAGLDRQIAEAQARARDAEDAAAVAARRAAAQAAQAPTVRAALNQISASRREDETRARMDVAQAERQRQAGAAEDARRRQASLAQPAGPGLQHGPAGAIVTGAIVRGYGEPVEGGAATGVSYAAASAARVSSPCGGRVVFAGPFRSFGRLMIIDCGGGYHFVLAGLDRLDVAVGSPVQPGEPVGVMAAWDPRNPAGRAQLYVELRDHGQPINPAPFLRAGS